MCWDAVAALGQWAGAIATTAAVVVALKPYKKKMRVDLKTITIKFNNKCQTIPMMLSVRNVGGMTMWIESYGISCAKRKNLHSLATRVSKCIEPNCAMEFPVGVNDVSKIIDAGKNKKICFWVEDQSGTIYFSPKYRGLQCTRSILNSYSG